MSWQLTLVVLWMQFAIGAVVILGLTRLALRWIPQPVERTRLIQCMLAAVLVLPLLSALSPFPSWGLGLISRRVTASRPAADDAHRETSNAMIAEHPVVSVDSVDTVASAAPKLAPVNSPDTREKPLTSQAPSVASSQAASLPASSALASRFLAIDVWSALALAIILIHAAAAMYFLVDRAIGKMRLRRLCRGATDAPESVYRAWTKIALSQGQSVRLLVSSEVDAPLVFGWLRPVVVMPFDLASKSSSERDACLAHEWSHIERADLLTWHFVNLCQFVLWYQPAFWSLRRELRICQEFLADYRSATSAMESVEYSELLLHLAKGRRSLGAVGALTMFDQPSQLARRIKMLLENRVPLSIRCRRRVTCGILGFAALLAVTISCVRVDSTQADEAVAPAEQVSTPKVPAVAKAAEPVKDAEPAKAADPVKAVEPVKDSKPAGRSLSYTQVMVTEGTQHPTIGKYYVAEDGRMRTELAVGNTTVFDKTGQIRLSLSERPKTALVYSPRTDLDYNVGGGRLRWLKSLKDLGDLPDKELGQKELDGKQATGFVARLRENTYTIWTDTATGDLLRVEYDSKINGSPTVITMSDFRFGETLDESLFSFEVPDGYKVIQRLAVASESDSAEKRAAEAPTGMQPARSHKGSWRAIAAIPQPSALYALGYRKLVTLDEQGKKLAESQTEQYNSIRMADLDGDGKYDLLTAENNGSTVKAHDADGKLLWTYARGQEPGHDWSVNDICAADLNGDGRDEVIIGFSGSTGLHVLDSQGKVLWKDTSIGNVWHVAAGNLEGYARPEVVSSSGDGKLHVFDGEGQGLRVLDAGFYANMVRVWQSSEADKSTGLIIAAGTYTNVVTAIVGEPNKKEMVAAIDAQGKRHWSLDLPKRAISAATCPQKPWLALTLADGTARVIDVVAGKEIARVGGQGEMTDAAWQPTQRDAPLLVIANGAALNAFRIGTEMP